MRGYILMPVSDGKYFTKISFDDMDLSLNHKWFLWRSPLNKIYPRRNGPAPRDKKHGKSIYLHREIAERMLGKIDKNLEVDHINRDPLDCRRENIRIVSRSINMQNKPSLRGELELKGIGQRKAGTWRAFCKNHIGTYETRYDAALAYDRKALELFGKDATTNQSLGLLPIDDGRELKTVVVDRTKRRKTYITNKSGFPDVIKRPSGNFRARIRFKGKVVWDKTGFLSAMKAHEARMQKITELGVE